MPEKVDGIATCLLEIFPGVVKVEMPEKVDGIATLALQLDRWSDAG
jgi:hypothetical protein